MKRLILFISVLPCVVACGPLGENEALVAERDSLRNELEASQLAIRAVQEVSVLMDSIDENREVLRMNMEEGTSYEDFKKRMEDLNEYVKNTREKIGKLEVSLEKSKSTGSAYYATIKKLKRDVEKKSSEIAQLQAQVETYRVEKDSLITTVEIQEAELVDKSVEIETKNQELALIEARIQELMKQAQMTEADAFFARGEAIEEAANRTKLAPKKKKDTYKQAVEMYQKALSLGREDAQAKIEQLETKI